MERGIHETTTRARILQRDAPVEDFLDWNFLAIDQVTGQSWLLSAVDVACGRAVGRLQRSPAGKTLRRSISATPQPRRTPYFAVALHKVIFIGHVSREESEPEVDNLAPTRQRTRFAAHRINGHPGQAGHQTKPTRFPTEIFSSPSPRVQVQNGMVPSLRRRRTGACGAR